MKNIVSPFLFLLFFGIACQPEVNAPEPYGALPSERQLRWHEMEMYSLIHYTPTTFQNKEWGYGDADPAIFNPKKFDADQIANAAAAAGFKGLISVAKHHRSEERRVGKECEARRSRESQRKKGQCM